MRKLTNEEFLEKLHKLKGDEYTALEEYKGATTKIKFRHNTCGRVFENTPDKMYHGGCIECGYKQMKKKQRKTNEQFLTDVYELVGDEYTFLDEYVNNRVKLKVIHNSCGHKYMVVPRDFLSGRRCPNCKGKRISESANLTHEEFMDRLNKVLEDNFKVLSMYKNAKTKLKVKHLDCGLVYEVLPHKILNGNRCPVCSFKKMGKERAKSQEEFNKDVFDIHGKEYIILGQYERRKQKVLVRHSVCGYEWEVWPDTLLAGGGCPRCKESRGEKVISSFLNKYNIHNEPQHMFDDCKYIEKLRFDFAVFENENITHLIEYQGIQHYKPVDFFGGERQFEEQIIKDNIKRKYCKDNGIQLIEIPYHIKDIENYLKDELTTLIPR